MQEKERESKWGGLQVFFAVVGAIFFILLFVFLFLLWLLNKLNTPY